MVLRRDRRERRLGVLRGGDDGVVLEQLRALHAQRQGMRDARVEQAQRRGTVMKLWEARSTPRQVDVKEID